MENCGCAVKLLTMLGLPFAAATVLVVLLVANRPVSLKELSHLTGYGKGHLSSLIRLLESKKLVERIRAGGRRTLFAARKEALVSVVKSYLGEVNALLKGAQEELGGKAAQLSLLERELEVLLAKLEGEGNGLG